ncbi:hypothetical protein IWQ55_000323 [Labrenzia sp. EL_208]|nr:hypothetical protein [Labrenzia sp. EL_132]MBG6227131.1 hypothetical protein [Labrenzia sp. EL_208]
MAKSDNFRTEAEQVGEARLSYGQGLYEARKDDKGSEKYSITLIFDQGSEGEKILKKLVKEAVIGKWGDNGVELFKADMIKYPILSGTGKSARNKETGEIKEGLGEGKVFIRPSRNSQVGPPQVVDQRVLPITFEDYKKGKIKSGDYVYPVLNAYTWENEEQGKGVSFGLEMVQLVKKGDALGGDGAGRDPKEFYKKIDTSGGAGDKPASETSADNLFD